MRQTTTNLLGIDVGTSGTRALIINEVGQVVASSSQEHVPFASPQIGWAEQEPVDWWKATCAAVRQALSHATLGGNDIACIGFSGQMHGAVMLDEQDRVVRPALIWCDVRTAHECRRLTERVGAERLIQLTSNPALPNFTATKLLWVREHEPEQWERIRSLMLPKDYVRLRLTGERATDVADASGTLLLDVAHRRWSREMLAAAEIPEQFLPQLYESTAVCGRVSAEGAAATALNCGTPVVAGAGDQGAGAVGLGIVTPGAVSATIGTSGVVFAATDQPALDPKGRLHTFCHAIPNRWHVMGVTQAAGLSLRWFRDNFADAGENRYERLTAEAEAVSPGAEGLLWTPYLMGERTPHLDPNARAALVGLTASHTRHHVIRAILEGVGFSLRDTLTILEEMRVPVRSIRLGGGGARSPVWQQIQADIYGREVELVEAEEGPAYGAALLAGVAAGLWPSVECASNSAIRVARKVSPRPEVVELMRRQYAAYRRVYPATCNILQPATNAPQPQ
ncbi:MAG: xylulokinase [Acidobacteria bacterium]|nr:xylulokinase [Acidobacteriota bacterium]